MLSIVIPYFDNDIHYVIAATNTTETSKKPVGHKVAGAKRYEELWEKFSVIAVDNGGGMGGGGGAGDDNAFEAGNSGKYQDAGGTFGQAAGVGLGSGNQANLSGSGSGTKGTTTGSAIADALRELRSEIDESKAESLANVLESAINASLTAASIAESESIRASQQKRLQQERIRTRITSIETRPVHETPVYIEETSRVLRTVESTLRTSAPTSMRRVQTYYDNNRIAPEETIEISDIEPGDIIETTKRRSNININNKMLVEKPTKMQSETKYVEKNIAPTAAESEEILEVTEITPINRTEENYENEMTPTAADEEIFDTTTQSDNEVDDNNQTETLESVIESVEQTTVNETIVETAKKEVTDIEEGAGSKGGSDAEADEDLEGDDGVNESVGNANEHGQYQLETEGENMGKKIFEIDTTGNIGFEPEHLSVTNMRGMVIAFITLLFALGALIFVFENRDKRSRNNYF